MANDITTRIVLYGPEAEIARFKARCIKPASADSYDDGLFDFETLVPTPVTLPAGTTEREWSLENWGCKWGSSCLSDQSSRQEIDILFVTPNATPTGVLHALAAEFPTLEGSAWSGERANDWCTDNQIAAGVYTEGEERPLDAEMAQTLDIPWDDDCDDDDEDDDEEDGEEHDVPPTSLH